MFGLFSRKRIKKLEEKTHSGFSSVKKDINAIGKWIKHLERQDKQLFDLIFTLREDLSSVHEEIESLREGLDLAVEDHENKQVFKKLPVWTPVWTTL